MVVLVLGLAASSGELAAQTPPESPEVLRTGDVLRVQVWRQAEFSGEFEVTDRGGIAHPLYREVTAAGRPVAEVEEAVRTFLEGFESTPNVVVQGLFRVAVGGQVRQPNVHLLRPGTTVAEAVAMTGGIDERGRLDRVILRRGEEEYRLDLTEMSGDSRQVTVRSGDEIVVERRTNMFREYVLPAVSFAGGLASIYRVFR